MSSLFILLLWIIGILFLIVFCLSKLTPTTLNEYFVVEDAITVNGKQVLVCRPHEKEIDKRKLVKKARQAGYELATENYENSNLIALTKIERAHKL